MPVIGTNGSEGPLPPDSRLSSISPAIAEMLATQVRRMVIESGDPEDFDVRSWLHDWLYSPVPALNGRRPIDYLDTPENIDLISRMLASAQTGAYW
ncbi:antitoxin Xre/MbcA/ParS toxin-binding domain-containing protein [Burkholderia vietnamiensis]|uniref:antitoxin Xre/MbcA/ParS toxin-binding domain-containing protein n=2 Tax=Burkholderia vietnamiensis TaxID=60552 RepID=UPI00159301D6